MKIETGHYFTISRYGDHLDEVADWTDFAFVEAESKGAWWYHRTRRGFIRAMRDAVATGLKLHINIEESDPEKIIRLAAPLWEHVGVLDVEDESELKLKAMNERIIAIDDAVFAAGLRSKPIGAVLTNSAVRHLNGWRSAYMDWRGIELYISPQFQSSKAAAVAEVKRIGREQLGIIDDSKPILIVGHGNTSHGEWANMESLVAVQHATYEVAAADPRVRWIRWFNWGRKDGARGKPDLIAAHKAIARRAGR